MPGRNLCATEARIGTSSLSLNQIGTRSKAGKRGTIGILAGFVPTLRVAFLMLRKGGGSLAVNDNTIEFMPPEIHLILLTAVVLLSFFAARAYAAQEEGKAECGTGVIEKRAESEFSLMVDNNKCLLFSLAEDAVCFLNEKTVELSAVTSGRTVRVIFKNIKGRLLATGIVLMPLGADFAPRRG